MIQPNIGRDLVKGMASAGLRIDRAVNHQRNAGLHNRPGTHWAGFERDVKNGVVQPPRAQRLGRLRDGNHLGMGGRVKQPFALIVSSANDAAVERHDHRSDRHLILRQRLRGLIERQPHVLEMKRMPGVGQRQIEGG